MSETDPPRPHEAAREAFPHEQWEDATSIKFRHKGVDFELPGDMENITVARSRLTHMKDDERILAKEIRQAKILAGQGSSIYLLPKPLGPDGRHLPGPDALVDGIPFEFKTVTGGIGKIEKHFRDSRKQGPNTFILVANPNIAKNDVTRKLSGIVNSDDYGGGFEGTVIFTVGKGKSERTYSMKIKDLMR